MSSKYRVQDFQTHRLTGPVSSDAVKQSLQQVAEQHQYELETPTLARRDTSRSLDDAAPETTILWHDLVRISDSSTDTHVEFYLPHESQEDRSPEALRELHLGYTGEEPAVRDITQSVEEELPENYGDTVSWHSDTMTL